MKKSISILGCGWLGEPLAQDLIEKGYLVSGSTTNENKMQKFAQIGIKPFLIKLESLQSNIVEFLSSEVLIIALPSKNIDGFKNLINFIEKSDVKKVLFVSSTSVYPNSTVEITEETSVINSPLSEIEKLFITNTIFNTTVVRFGGLIGYNRKPGLFYTQGRLIDNPESVVNMIHRDDCIRIIFSIIENKVWGNIFNACADSHPTKREFYTKAALAIGLEIPLFENLDSRENKKVSNKKLKKILNYEFKYSDLLNIVE